LTANIRSNGGELRNYSEVKKIVEENGIVSHIELTNGERIFGKQFISNLHPAITMEMLDSSRIKKAYRNRISNLENSTSCFILDIVLKPNSFKFLNHNIYHYRRPDVWSSMYVKGELWPDLYCIFIPKSSRSDEFAESLSILTYMQFEEVKQWENTFATIPHHRDIRDEQYENFKREKAEKIISQVEKKFPNIRSCIQSYSTSSPLTYRDYIGSRDGGLYGIAKDYRDPLKTFISPITKIPNLLFTGQNLNMHGVLGVTVSAIRTCGVILGQNYLVSKINRT
jgi:all-trans-retinol 13,14-reductase